MTKDNKLNNPHYTGPDVDIAQENRAKREAFWARQPRDYKIARMVSRIALGTGILAFSAPVFLGYQEDELVRSYAQPQEPAVMQTITQAKKYLTDLTYKIGSLESEMAMPYESEALRPLVLEKNQKRKDEQLKLLRETEVVQNDILAMEKDPRIFHYKTALEEHLKYLEQGKATMKSVKKITSRALPGSVLLWFLAGLYSEFRRKK